MATLCHDVTCHDEEPESMREVILDAVQEGAMEIANGLIEFAHAGVLYAAQEVVYALSPSRDDDASIKVATANATTEKKGPGGKTKKQSKKKTTKAKPRAKEQETREPSDIQTQESSTKPDITIYNDTEAPDEPSDRPRVRDLIGKFDRAGPSHYMRSHLQQQPHGQNVHLQKSQFWNMIPLPGLHDSESQMATESLREVFRPRSIQDTQDDPDRYSYLMPDPLTPLIELHKVNQRALLDKASAETRRNQVQGSNFRDADFMSRDDENTTRYSSRSGQGTIPTEGKRDLFDVRKEIEEITRILGKLERQRHDRLRTRDSSSSHTQAVVPPTKDPRRTEELTVLIQHLQRLSQRQKELKARALAEAAVLGTSPTEVRV